jgi:uncharacterized secreted protein with C-terminal beta-propeller domain
MWIDVSIRPDSGIVTRVRHETNLNTKAETMKTTTVIGRNGYEYEARLLLGNIYVVGAFIVRVIDGKCDRTLCRATKKMIALYSR